MQTINITITPKLGTRVPAQASLEWAFPYAPIEECPCDKTGKLELHISYKVLRDIYSTITTDVETVLGNRCVLNPVGVYFDANMMGTYFLFEIKYEHQRDLNATKLRDPSAYEKIKKFQAVYDHMNERKDYDDHFDWTFIPYCDVLNMAESMRAAP